MKKIGAILITLLLCFLSACSSPYEEDALNDYIEAINNMRDVYSSSLNAKLMIYNDSDRKQMNTKVTMNGVMLIAEDDLQMKLDASLSASGISFGNLSYYLKDRSMYIDFLGSKIKQNMEKELEPLYDSLSHSATPYNEETLKKTLTKLRYQDKENGLLYFAFDTDALKAQIEKENTGLDVGDIDVQRFDATMKLENHLWQEIAISIDILYEDSPICIDFVIQLDDINQMEKIEFPDFSDFIENETVDHEESDYTHSGKQKPDQIYEEYEQKL